MQRQLKFEATLSKRVSLRYLLYLPQDAHAAGRKLPLILFLHGSDERGDNLALVKRKALPRIAAQKNLPFVVVSPQCPDGTVWPVHFDALVGLLEDVSARYPIDTGRIYLTGISMGGSGVWHLAMTYPDKFAALVPVCADQEWYIGEPQQLERISHIPVWAFHGAQDDVIPAETSEQLVDAFREAGGEARLTVYEDLGHNCWNRAYAEDELYAWLLEQTLHA